MALFLVVMPGWKPADYWAITQEERDAIIKAHREYNSE